MVLYVTSSDARCVLTIMTWKSVAPLGRGGEGGTFQLLSDPGDPFSIQTVKYCSLSLSTFDGNKQFMSFGVRAGSARANFRYRAHCRIKRAHLRHVRGLSNAKWAKNDYHFLGGALSTRGTLP